MKFFIVLLLIFSLMPLQVCAKDYDDVNTLLGFIEEGHTDSLYFRRLLLAFQADHNLSTDGVIGEKTNLLLEHYGYDQHSMEVSDIIPAYMHNQPSFIVINKDLRILTLYRYGKVYDKYPVALGKSSTPTPNHRFIIDNKAVNPVWGGLGKGAVPGGIPENPLGHYWMGLSKKFYAGYGIHGNNNPWSIGEYASSGCIRMMNEHVEDVFGLVSIGTPVWIGSSDVLNHWGVYQDLKIVE